MFDVNITNGRACANHDLACPAAKSSPVPTDGVGHLPVRLHYLRFCEITDDAFGAKFFSFRQFFSQHGQDHWEPLLRARAIENACYVVAPRRRANSLASPTPLDDCRPVGNILACAPDRPSVSRPKSTSTRRPVRAQLPVAAKPPRDVYALLSADCAGRFPPEQNKKPGFRPVFSACGRVIYLKG
jgi:hypothetical protein